MPISVQSTDVQGIRYEGPLYVVIRSANGSALVSSFKNNSNGVDVLNAELSRTNLSTTLTKLTVAASNDVSDRSIPLNVAIAGVLLSVV